MQNNEGQAFKKLAKEAVSRMKHGFWEDMKARKANGEIATETQNMSMHDREQIQKTVISKSGVDNAEIEFEKKVFDLLDQDEISPIGKLMDKEKYGMMSSEERGRYVLQISNKFLQAKQKYEREKMLKNKYEKVMQTLHM